MGFTTLPHWWPAIHPPPIKITLEKALAYIEDGELVEVTPESIRLRKKLLDENDRRKSSAEGSRRGRLSGLGIVRSARGEAQLVEAG